MRMSNRPSVAEQRRGNTAIHDVRRLIRDADKTLCEISPGHYVPARPVTGLFRLERLRAAWEVLRGRADAVIWPGQP